ncbi:MAG: hypothetical protein ACRBBK_05295 [Paracoccaceae bacterium]
MLKSDLLLHRKFTPEKWTPGPPWAPATGPALSIDQSAIEEADIKALQDYLQNIDANIVVPDPKPSPSKEQQSGKAAEEKPFWEFELKGPSTKFEDGGVSVETKRGVREYLNSGYTRRNPDGTFEVDNDLNGKWQDEFTLLEGTAEHEFFDVAVAEGEFGDDDSFISAHGSAFGASADTEAGIELSNKSQSGKLRATIKGAVLDGTLETDDSLYANVVAKGSALSGEAEAKAELILSPKQVTLEGKLGAEVNILEVSVEGNRYITPRRAINPAINLWNKVTNDDVAQLDENWDIGIYVGGEVSGQLGAQIGVEGEVGYEKGRATAEVGAKLGAGLGVGAKLRGGFVGVDKAVAQLEKNWVTVKKLWDSDWFSR